MASDPLRQQIATMRQSFFDEGLLDELFVQLEDLEDDDTPNIVEEIVTMYFRESAKIIALVEKELENPPYNFTKLDKTLHQLKGSSSSIGAVKVLEEVNRAGDYCCERNVEGAKAALELVKKENDTLRSKLEPYFQLLRQAGPSETAERPKQGK